MANSNGKYLVRAKRVARGVSAGRFVALVVPALLLAACAKPEAKAQAYYDNAMQLIEKKQDVAARMELINALKYKSDKVEAWRALAGVDERTGATQGLFRDLKRVTELDPNDTEAKLRLARFMVQAGAADAAQGLIASIDDSAKPNADLHAIRALILIRQKDLNNAVAEAKKAHEIDPGNKDAALILASQQAAHADFGDALQILAKADTGEADTRLSATKVQIYERQGDLAKAETELKKLIEANPKEVTYHAQLAQLYIAQKRNDEAERELRTIMDLRPNDSKAGIELVRFLGATKGAPAAQHELEALIKKGGNVIDYQLALVDLEVAQGKYDEAKSLVQALIAGEKTPANIAAAQSKLAELYARKRDYDSADKTISEVLNKDRRNIPALKLRAAIRLSQGHTDDAISDLREALNDQPKAPDLLLLMAQAYEAGKKIELADRQYNEAIKASNYNPNVGLAYVAFLQRTSNLSRADDILVELTNRNDKNVQLWSALAQVRLAERNWTGATQVADTIEKIGNTSAIANEIRAAAAAGQNKPDETIADLEKAHQAAPTAVQPIVALANAYVQQKQFDKALGLLQDMQAKFPDNPQLWLLVGGVQQAKGSVDDAIKAYQTAIDKQPKSDAGYRALIQLLSRQKRYDEAIATADAALKQLPGNLNFRLTHAGLVDLKGDHDGSIAEYEAILKDQPDSIVAINNLVSMLIDYRTDKASLDRAQELADKLKNSKVPQFEDTLGWALYQRGDFSGASSVLEQAKSQLPNLAAIRYHLGMTYRSLGEKDKAEAELKAAMDLETNETPLKQKIRASLKEQG